MTCNHLNFGMTRRDFFGRFALGLGGAALAQMVNAPTDAAEAGGKFSPGACSNNPETIRFAA